MWPAWDGWRGVGLDGREVGPAAGCLVGLAMAAVWWIWTLIVR